MIDLNETVAADALLAEILLKDDNVAFEGISKTNTNTPLKFDYIPPVGRGDGFRGLELLVLTMGGCFSTAVVYNLRKMGRSINSFHVRLKGVKNESVLSLKRVDAEIEIISDDISQEELSKSIRHAMEMSPVLLSVKGNVEFVVSGNIQRSK